MSDNFPPKDEREADPGQKKTIRDAASDDNTPEATKPVNKRNPSPKAPLPRDPSGGRPANG